MWDKLIQYFNGRKFNPVDLHREGLRLFYTEEDRAVSLVWMVGDTAVSELDGTTLRRYADTIRRSFLEKGYEFVQLHILFLTSNVARARELGEGQMFWIADEAYGRLVIFENQPEEFLGLRKMLETNLSFGGSSRNSEGLQHSAYGAKEVPFPDTPETEREKRRILRSSKRKKAVGMVLRSNYVTYGIVLLNLLVFLYQDLLADADFTYRGAISWETVVGAHQWWRILTCLFLHASADHIMGNMIGLFAAGDIVEKRVGHARFALLYFLSGIGASLSSVFYHAHVGEGATYSIGASGAIYGIFGALVIIMLLDPVVRTRGNFSRMAVFILFLFYDVFLNPESGIDYAGHIGGFLVGSLICLLFIFLRSGKADPNKH